MKVTRTPLCVGALMALLLAGCAATQKSTGGSAEDVVGRLAEQRWAALIAGDVEGAYAFLSPGYRQALSIDGYKAQLAGSRVQWHSVTGVSVNCDTEQTCEAKVSVKYGLLGQALAGVDDFKSQADVVESWVKPGNDGWFYLPRD